MKNLLQITRVDIVDDWTLDIELSNRHLILFDMRQLMKSDPAYSLLWDREVLPAQVPTDRAFTGGTALGWSWEKSWPC